MIPGRIRDDPRLTYADLILETGKSQRTLSRVLDALKRKSLITRVGSNKTGYWQVKSGFLYIRPIQAIKLASGKPEDFAEIFHHLRV